MSQKLLDVYKTSTFELAQSVVINHVQAAEAVNLFLYQNNYNVSSDKTTWKYYMNMAGEYHLYDYKEIQKINQELGLGLSAGVDQTKMIIKIATDAGQVEREFTVENISSENADFTISKDYQFGTTLYKELVSRYPAFETLIRGILHPISKHVSTNAPMYEVLYAGGYYRTRLSGRQSEYAYIKGDSPIYSNMNLIEEWELELVDEINKFTKVYFSQHSNHNYGLVDDLYHTASIAIYYLNLPATIMGIRLNNVKTAQVHPVHVQMYLDSFAGLGAYIPYLSRHQYMYLYRNLPWLSANTGKTKVLDELIRVLLDELQIPVIYYNLNHDLDRIAEDKDVTPVFIKEYHNDISRRDSKKELTTSEIVSLETDIARENKKYQDDQIAEINKNSLASKSNETKTKVIETQYINWEINDGVTNEEFVASNWIYSSLTNEYKGIISVTIPGYGSNIQLSARSAVMLFIYAYGKGYLNIDAKRLPKLKVYNVPKTVDEMSSLDQFLDGTTSNRVELVLDDLMAGCPTSRSYNSSSSFAKAMETAWLNYVDRKHLAYKDNHFISSPEVEYLTECFYHNRTFSFNLDMDLSLWVSTLGINTGLLTQDSWKILTNSILKSALGSVESISMEKIHKALINIIKTLTSYNIQWVTTTRENPISSIGTKGLKFQNLPTTSNREDIIYIAIYPSYSSNPSSSQARDITACNFYYTSGDQETNLLTQEQLKALITAESGHGIIYTGEM